jgi:3-oxoacyl-[acyl-carrier protein] reductase
MDSGLHDKVVMITGASGGIGSGLVQAFTDEGARIVAHYDKNRNRAVALADKLGRSRCIALGADLCRENEVSGLFHQAEEGLGPIEVLVANAGAWPPEDVGVEDMPLDRWQATLDTDLTSVFLCVREFFRGIRRSRLQAPAAVLIGSTAGIFGEAGHADYAAAKAGLIYGLARSLKNEIARLAPRGRINVVCPGWVRTPMTEGALADRKQVERTLQTMPLRKIARIEDVAHAVVYLASDRLAGHISGDILTVAGGMEGRVLYTADELRGVEAS